jgi:cobalamin synthase
MSRKIFEAQETVRTDCPRRVSDVALWWVGKGPGIVGKMPRGLVAFWRTALSAVIQDQWDETRRRIGGCNGGCNGALVQTDGQATGIAAYLLH